MAIEFKRGKRPDGQAVDDRVRREAEQTREEFGILRLLPDEELIDDETFSQLHDELLATGPGGASALGDAEDGGACDELLLEEVVTELPGASRSDADLARAPVPEDVAGVARLERRLLVARDRDEVVATALAIARFYAPAVALFVVHQGRIAGLRGSGGGLERGVEGVAISADADGLLAEPVRSGRIARGAAPFEFADRVWLCEIGRGPVHHVAVLPVAIGERVVSLLYADAGPEPLAETALAALRALTVGTGRVYERLILERKRATRGG